MRCAAALNLYRTVFYYFISNKQKMKLDYQGPVRILISLKKIITK